MLCKHYRNQIKWKNDRLITVKSAHRFDGLDFFFIFDVVPNPGLGTHSIFPSTTSAQSLLETVEIFPENVNLVKPGFWGGLKPKPDHVVVTFIEGFFCHFYACRSWSLHLAKSFETWFELFWHIFIYLNELEFCQIA